MAVWAILGFISAMQMPLHPGETATAHFMQSLFCGFAGGFFGIFATVIPIVLAAVGTVIFVLGTAGLGWIWLKGIWNSFLNRS
jgi:hypothetical protein